MSKDKERAEPPQPHPVQLGGVRYEALLWGKARGLGQNGGLLAAFDAASGKELWTLKVYDVHYNAAIEGDKQDRFIETLAADGPHHLLVQAERGAGRFRVDVRDRSVTRL